MIIFLLIITAILFFVSWNLNVEKRTFHTVFSTISTVLFFAAVALSIGNFHDHFGMHKATTTQTTKASSLNPKMAMVLHQDVGTSNRDQALIYKNGAQKVVVKPDTNVKNIIVQTSAVKKAALVTKTTRWKYNSSFNKLMFGLAQKESVYYKKNTLYVPKTWLVVTPKQAKALPTVIKQVSARANSSQAEAQMAAEGKSYVQKAVMDAMKKHPKLSADQQAKIGKQAATEFKAKVQQQALAKMMPTIKQQLAKIK